MSTMTDEQALAAYEMLRHLSQRMLASTRQGEWEQMPQQHEELAMLLHGLQAGDGQVARPPGVMALKKALIEEILAAQQAAVEIALPWRDSVAAMLDSAGSAKRVALAYGQGG